jgi:hypothetical protein
MTWDGITIKCYINGKVIVRLEISEILASKLRADEADIREKRRALLKAERDERSDLQKRVESECIAYFSTKEGSNVVKKIASQIMESDAFQDDNIGAEAKDKGIPRYLFQGFVHNDNA